MLGQNLPIKRTGSLDSQGDPKKARHVSGAVGSPDSQGSKTTESNKPIEKLYCDAVVNFLLKIACQVSRMIFALPSNFYMSSIIRKHVFGVSLQVRRKPGCTVIQGGLRLEISDLRRRGLYYLGSENKGADQLHSTVQLICVFVFILQKSGFHMTQLI